MLGGGADVEPLCCASGTPDVDSVVVNNTFLNAWKTMSHATSMPLPAMNCNSWNTGTVGSYGKFSDAFTKVLILELMNAWSLLIPVNLSAFEKSLLVKVR